MLSDAVSNLRWKVVGDVGVEFLPHT